MVNKLICKVFGHQWARAWGNNVIRDLYSGEVISSSRTNNRMCTRCWKYEWSKAERSKSDD